MDKFMTTMQNILENNILEKANILENELLFGLSWTSWIIVIAVIGIASFIIWIFGFWLISRGVEQEKTWKILLGIIIAGIIWGVIYYLIKKSTYYRKKDELERKNRSKNHYKENNSS